MSIPSVLVGRVESSDLHNLQIVVDDPTVPGYLRWHTISRRLKHSKGAKVGDTVELRYYSSWSCGFWYVSAVLASKE